MINLRRMGLTKKSAPVSNLQEISPIQKKMMDFYKDNPRCVIMAPRQCGKTTFAAMQAIISKYNNTLLIAPNPSMLDNLIQAFKNVCSSNDIKLVKHSEPNHYIIAGYHIKFMTYSQAKRNQHIFCHYNEIIIDEYAGMPMDLYLANNNNVILIGDRTDEYHMDPDITGVFSGLNINGG